MVHSIGMVKDGHTFVFQYRDDQRVELATAVRACVGREYGPPDCEFGEYDARQVLNWADDQNTGRFWYANF